MKHDGIINVATGFSAGSRIWKNTKIKWSVLVKKLTKENKTNETLKEYISASKSEQGKIKDVGGYVGAYLRNQRRKPENIVSRQLLTLDIDYAHSNFWDDFCMQYSSAAVLHSTHSHTEENPRYRLIMPLDRETTPDEYVALARQIAGVLGIDLFDSTTFETNRLMFWPSNPIDTNYYYKVQDGPWISCDEILDCYEDWTDSSRWPTSKKESEHVNFLKNKQQDPIKKTGSIGLFCRTFSIQDSIQNFLNDIYSKISEDRYTYKNGSTAGGLVIYDDKFAYSHHGTDPCGGKLCNAFDLVRIHLFGHLDTNINTSPSNQKSFKLMENFVVSNEEVKKLIATENISEANYDFKNSDVEEIIDIEWAKELEVNTKGDYLSSAINIDLIFNNDPRLLGAFKYNMFDNKRYIYKSVPWRKIDKPEPIKNVDYSGVRNYLEIVYKITGSLKIDDSLALQFEKNSFHPVKDYLKNLKWDGIKRIDDILIDYFGADKNIYTKEAIRKPLVGAVARILNPGIKFDLVLTLVGPQGTGKSTLVDKLGLGWSSDTFTTVHGKEAFEQLQGAWLMEIAELSGLRKAEVEAVKHFISKREDTFRPAYARDQETFPRQCVFIGTTNNKDFLKDPTGNRRFLPVDINIDNIKKSIFKLSKEDIDNFWAEAVHLYKNKEKLYLSKEANFLAIGEQKKHSSIDEREGLIEKYLDILLPENWDEMSLENRKMFLYDPNKIEAKTERVFVCVAEIWCECLGKEKSDMNRYKTRDINEILRNLKNWEQSNSTKNFPIYGKQKYYSRSLF